MRDKMLLFGMLQLGSRPVCLISFLLTTNMVRGQTPEQILLKDYRPHSIFKIPDTRVEKAKYAIIDAHSHNYARTDAEVARWVQTMDAVGIERTTILTGSTGAKYDEARAKFGRYPGRFAVWCGLD